MSAPAPPSAEVERFAGDLERLTGAEPAKLGVAVSGGPDSVALLLLANAAYPGRVHAATVDHGLRAESAGEARFVAGLCAGLSVPHSILAVEVPEKGEGLQGEARRARYHALSAWALGQGIGLVCTAHHADDQAETILMRLQRGSGVGGLAGVRAIRREGALTVARPLLGWRRSELNEVVRACCVTAIDDPSNRDTRFDRVSVRQFLSGNPQFQASRLARSAASLAEANEALEWAVDMLEAERCASVDGEWRIDTASLPRELKRRLLNRAIAGLRREQEIHPAWSGGEDVENLLRTLEAGGTATLAGTMASADGPLWRIRPAPPRRS